MKHKKVTYLLLIVILLAGVFVSDLVTYANFEGFKSNCTTEVSSSDSNDKSTNIEGDSSGGSWETEGTKAHGIAKNMWNFWKNKGFGGSAIAGVMGNVDHEGGFDITDRAEGHYGSTSKENGISEGNVPAVGAGYPVGASGKPEGGAGHYQFTPYSKFAPVGDEKWKSTEKQSDFVWNSEVKSASWLTKYINETSPETAAEHWSAWFERPASYDTRKSASAKKAYQVFGGANISPDSSLANATESANDGEEESKEREAKTNGCSSSNSSTSANPSSGKIVALAKELLGYFSYLQVHGESYIGSIENPKKSGVTDCSGFVWLVLARAGYKVPDNMAWFTGSMETDARKNHEWLEEIKASEAKAGDIVIVNVGGGAGSNGHTAILVEDWKDEPLISNSTVIIQMGGAGSAFGVNEGSFSGSFSSLIGNSSTVTFARAIKK